MTCQKQREYDEHTFMTKGCSTKVPSMSIAVSPPSPVDRIVSRWLILAVVDLSWEKSTVEWLAKSADKFKRIELQRGGWWWLNQWKEEWRQSHNDFYTCTYITIYIDTAQGHYIYKHIFSRTVHLSLSILVFV